jgi:general secretion pathway protein D
VSNLVNTIETKSGTTAYQIGTRQASTMLQLKDGENQVLAGLINNEERNGGNRVPALGDLPILGRLFGTQRDETQKTEIVLSITPHLVRNLQRPPAEATEFSAGTEANFRRKPELSVRAPVLLPQRGAPVNGTPAAPGTSGMPAAPPTPQESGTPVGVPLSTSQPGPASSVTQQPVQVLPVAPPPPTTLPPPATTPPPVQEQ